MLKGNDDGTFEPEQRFTAGFGSNSVAVVDVSDDGKVDLVTANNNSSDVSVLLGNGAGNFQSQQRFLTGNRPVAMTVVDVNGDGEPDIITANRNSNTVSVILHR